MFHHHFVWNIITIKYKLIFFDTKKSFDSIFSIPLSISVTINCFLFQRDFYGAFKQFQRLQKRVTFFQTFFLIFKLESSVNNSVLIIRNWLEKANVYLGINYLWKRFICVHSNGIESSQMVIITMMIFAAAV